MRILLKFIMIGSAPFVFGACNSDTGKETKKKNEEKIIDIKDGSFVVPSPSPSATATPTPAP